MGQSANQPVQNVFQGSAQAMQQAGQTFGEMAQGQMNPYTQNVIDRTQQDIMRQQQLAEQNLGAQATAAGAFGGSPAVGQQGEFMRSLEQQLIDAAKGQYAGMAGTPLAGLGALTSVLGAARFPTMTSTTGTATTPYDPTGLLSTFAYNTVLGGSPTGAP